MFVFPILRTLVTAAELVECGLWAGDSEFSQPMTYQIDTCCFLAWRSALIGQDWLTQCQDNVTEYDIRSWCWWPDFIIGQHYKVTMSAHCHKLVPVLIWS